MTDRFYLENSPIIVYGYRGRGKQIGKALEKSGYDLVGYVDRDAGCFDDTHIPVYTFDGFLSKDLSGKTVIIVSLQSGMLHDGIAQMFASEGFLNILYCPMELSYSYEYRQTVRSAYQKVISGEFGEVGAVPVYMRDEEATKHRVIRKSDGYVSFWCPVSDIKCCSPGLKMEKDRFSPQICSILAGYEGCTIDRYSPYSNLYRYLDGENVDIDDYLALCGICEENREEWMKSRAKLYDVFNDALVHDLTFFTDSPSPCIWYEITGQGEECLILDEGTTRAHYLIHKGYDEIPIIVTTSDYERYTAV